jgi:serine/threonine-protein kinase
MVRPLRFLILSCLVFNQISFTWAADKPDELAAQARAVLRTNCARCHNGPGSESGEDFNMLRVEELVKVELVKPGNPDGSRLLERIFAEEMPPQPTRMVVKDADTIRRWIKAGAPAFVDDAGSRPFVALDTVLKAMFDYLSRAERRDRSYFRFFTLHHLANDPRVSDADLALARAALSKAVNSLSWKPRVVPPRPLDKEQTVFAIDLRDYDWDRTGGWTWLMHAYPYGLKFGSLPDDTLRRLDDDLSELSECSLYTMRGDWFVANATRPPLYYQILEIPNVAADLERLLRVDIAADFMKPTPERVARAGFSKSGVSGQNRLVERHDAAHGYYWKSYDFKPDSGRTKLTRFPLGPLNLFPEKRHPYADQAFAHDGGEIIFSLPNGLSGYMLIDGKDQRIDEGPIQVVGDALKTSGTSAIANGVSCMACHKHGMIRFKDTIRAGNAVGGEAERHVQRLYPPHEVMDRLLDEDEQRFMLALERAVKPFLQVGANKQRDLKDFPEPVGEVARAYRLGFLDIQTVACELNSKDPDALQKQLGSQRLKELGLEALSSPGGVIGRLEWEASNFSRNGISLMQEVARELRFTPVK